MSILDSIPDISFIGDISVEKLKEIGINEYKSALSEITGETVTQISDEDKAKIYAQAQIMYQVAEIIHHRARQNSLKYASGAYLDNKAISRLLQRKQEEYAVTTIRFTLSAVRENVIAIPVGTRVTGESGNVYFATSEYAEILPGNLYVDVLCTATDGGSAANNYEIGELSTLVDPIAYIDNVKNIDNPLGGADVEDDDTLRERIYNSRYLYSTTGSEGAYIYYVKSYSSLIDDVVIDNPSDAEIEIYILLKDRDLATESFIEGLSEYINNPDIKAITDHITIKNVERVEYSIDVEYSICNSDISALNIIQQDVKSNIYEYTEWQSQKIGRDIDIQKLISYIIQAGGRKIRVNSPSVKTITNTQIAYCTGVNITYKGTVEE